MTCINFYLFSTNKSKRKNKKISLPKDPDYFRHVSGNTANFFLRLMTFELHFNLFITCLIIMQLSLQHNHVVAPKTDHFLFLLYVYSTCK